jgi:hypothetical protein
MRRSRSGGTSVDQFEIFEYLHDIRRWSQIDGGRRVKFVRFDDAAGSDGDRILGL